MGIILFTSIATYIYIVYVHTYTNRYKELLISYCFICFPFLGISMDMMPDINDISVGGAIIIIVSMVYLILAFLTIVLESSEDEERWQ